MVYAKVCKTHLNAQVRMNFLPLAFAKPGNSIEPGGSDVVREFPHEPAACQI